MTERLPDPPEAAVEGRTTHWGRYRAPIPRPNLRPAGRLGRFRLKEWCFMSVTTERWFLSFAVVQLGYVGNAFCYLVDRADPAHPWEHEVLTPLGAGLRISPSSVSGRSTLDWGDARVEVRWTGAWEVQLDVPLERAGLEARLHGGFRVQSEEALALLHPLAPGRPAYTHKAAGMPVHGMLSLAGEEIPLDGGLATLDWTRSVALRDTRWKWASLAARLFDGRRIGLNLSAEVYDDPDGSSRENALWLEGSVHPLPGVDFQIPLEPSCQPWRVRSQDRSTVDLVFHPGGARTQRMALGVVRSDFIQAFGTWEGRISPPDVPPVELEGIFGVAEDHYARW